MTRPLRFGALINGSGSHIAGWRLPGAVPDGALDIGLYRRAARVLDDAGFAALFVADVAAIWGHQLDSLHRTARADFFEPLTLLSALAPVTDRIGLVATVSTSYAEPYNVARRFASLDHLSKGRAGWNVVTSVVPLEAANHGRDAHFGHAERYARADEFVTVVRGLWDGWADDAAVRDKASGVFVDLDRRRALDHVGEHFRVAGPLNISRPPQGHPVIFQAGASPVGRAFAARHADVVFTAPTDLPAARAYRTALDADLAAAGRVPADVQVWPLLNPIVADTDAEAGAILAELGSLIHDDVLRRLVQDTIGDDDFSDLDLDEPLPDLLTDTNRSRSRRAGILRLAEDAPTLRALAVRVAAEGAVAGSPETIADRLGAWQDAGVADGFTVSFPYLTPAGTAGPLERFAGAVLPILADRGRFTPATGPTLRDSLGLPIPSDRFGEVSA